jgi:hypothetical protein
MLDSNYKTYKSLDFTTLCPKVKKGNQCEYCYVQNARNRNTGRAKKISYMRPYKDSITRFRQTTVDKLNAMGGLRLFAFGDYEPWMKDNLNKVIQDAKKKELKLKAITKQMEFVELFKDRVFINISVDAITPIREWVWDLRGDNVKVRMLIRNKKEAEIWHKDIDVLTPYHGPKINENYRAQEARDACTSLAPEKTCCITPTCVGCGVMCGSSA